MNSFVSIILLCSIQIAYCNECYENPNGNDYRGTLTTTRNGHVCQKWTSSSPNRHDFTDDKYPSFDLGDHNYCRNPGNEHSQPWCFIVTGQGYDFCDVGPPSDCGEVYTDPPFDGESSIVEAADKVDRQEIVLFNIAYEGMASQSSTEEEYSPSLAVDNNKNSNLSGMSCSQTKRQYEPWWKLDLKHGHEIYQVVVTNRFDCCSWRFKNAEVRVGYHRNFRKNAICGKRVTGRKWRAETIVFDCFYQTGEPIWGKYISIQLFNYVKPLTLCEVEVMTKVSDDWAELTKNSEFAKILKYNF